MPDACIPTNASQAQQASNEELCGFQISRSYLRAAVAGSIAPQSVGDWA